MPFTEKFLVFNAANSLLLGNQFFKGHDIQICPKYNLLKFPDLTLQINKIKSLNEPRRINRVEKNPLLTNWRTRWIDRLILFHFDIKHLAGNKMGLIDYMSRNPVGLAIPPSDYDKEFVVASNNAFINNLELIENVILNNLANENKAPYEQIKKCAEIKRSLDVTSNTQIKNEHSKLSIHSQLRTKTKIQSHSKTVREQSALHFQKSLKTKQPVRHTTVNLIQHFKMSRRTEFRGFKGGFIPSELKNTKTNEQNTKTDTQWQGSSDREGSLSDPRWHKRPPTKGKKTENK